MILPLRSKDRKNSARGRKGGGTQAGQEAQELECVHTLEIPVQFGSGIKWKGVLGIT